MRRIWDWACAGLPGVLVGCAPLASRPGGPDAVHEGITPDAFHEHVRVLADPAMGGRMTGTPENRRAAEYIVRQFQAAGLAPGAKDDSWFQQFPVDNVRVPGQRSCLRFGPPPAPAATLHVDFSPMAAGRSGAFRGPLVFAGYGLRNRIRGYSDYANVDARGAVVLVCQGEPHEKSDRSRWGVVRKWTRLASVEHKLRQAADNGAVAALVVTPPDISPHHDPLYHVYGEGHGPLPSMRIRRGLADRLLAAGGAGETLAGLLARIHETGKPRSFAVDVEVAGEADLQPGAGRNVLGVLPSEAGGAAPVVVLGAHYDHIPASGAKAWDSGFGVRPGADDNASGVSVLILAARALARTPGRRCTFLFAAFSGEEIGFLGSRHFVADPPVDLKRVAAMINIDQVGRVRNGRVTLIAGGYPKGILEALRKVRPSKLGLRVFHVPFTSKRRWSDQAAFAAAGIPTLFFYAGPSRYYNTMQDTPANTHPDGGAKVAHLIYEIARALDSAVEFHLTAAGSIGTGG